MVAYASSTTTIIKHIHGHTLIGVIGSRQPAGADAVLTPSMTRGHKLHTTDPPKLTTVTTHHGTATGKHTFWFHFELISK